MSTIGRTIVVKGEVHSLEDLIVQGRIDGPIVCEDSALVLEASSTVSGDILARDITVFGQFDGQLVATETVDIRADATVTGRVVTRRFILNDGAMFCGRAEPQHLEAALRVWRFQQKKRAPARR